MYFEPHRKTYYRFPSIQSVKDLDRKFYFPEKPTHSEEDFQHEDPLTSQIIEKDHPY